jgi:magnesium chelatase family protein
LLNVLICKVNTDNPGIPGVPLAFVFKNRSIRGLQGDCTSKRYIGFEITFMLAKVFGSAVYGIEAIPVTVEVNIDQGVGYHLVGLPDNAIRESNYRIASALSQIGYRIPGKKITINLSPADLRKEGASYDLPLALGILTASGQLVSDTLPNFMIMGELSLDGSLQPIKGALPIALAARKSGLQGIVLPKNNVCEASVVEGLEVLGAENLFQVIEFFKGGIELEREFKPEWNPLETSAIHFPDFSDVRGQETVKRCMEIAAAGGHNVILIGPPGSGKTMLARRLPGILPPMNLDEALETTKIHSVVGAVEPPGLLRHRPFRSPHHTISYSALVGGGAYPQPGEISLAHNGVLFLDELPEFKRHVLEVLRQPLEDRQITISRSRFTITYPSSFMLVASMNPSPSGFFNTSGLRDHGNSPSKIRRYMSRISGPLLDRIDIHLEVSPVNFDEISSGRQGESSLRIRQRVIACRDIQVNRFAAEPGIHSNAQMTSQLIRRYSPLNSGPKKLLKHAMQRLELSARAYDRILKVARTIADLDTSTEIGEAHLAEAIQYRSLDREGWLG